MSKIKKLGMVAVSVGMVANSLWAAFDTTEYVVGASGGSSTANDSPILKPSCWTWPSGETPVEMDPNAKYYTKVTLSYFYLDHDVTAPGTEWVLDRRSTQAGKYSTFLFSGGAWVTFPNLIVNDGGTRFQCWSPMSKGVSGKVTVKATKEDPFQVVYDTTGGGTIPFSNLTLVGDSTAGVELCGPTEDRTTYVTAKITFSDCDLTDFSGRVRVRMLRDAPIPEDVFMAFHPGVVTCPGELLCEAGGAISLADTTGAATFGTLTLEDGARLQGIGPGKCLAVTETLTVRGKVIVDLKGATATTAAEAWTVFDCASGVDVSAVDLSKFVFVNAPTRSKIDFVHTSYLKWFDETDGGKVLKIVLPKIVSRERVDVTTDRSDFEYATKTNGGTDYYWDHQGAPGLDADAADVIYLDKVKVSYVPTPPSGADVYTFPGRTLLLSGDGIGPSFVYQEGKVGLEANILSVGACLIAQNGKLKGEASKLGYCDPETGGEFWTALLRGTLKVYLGEKPAELRSTYGTQRQLRIESTIAGTGDIKFSAYRNNNPSEASVNAGTFELMADNSAFSGKMALTEDYVTVKGTSNQTPDATDNIRLIVSDSKALGGAREEFAFDALFLEHYSRLMVRDNVTLASDLNRGVAIGDFGGMWVPEGKTLTVNQPLNLNGQLEKQGAGTLVLGGTAMTFGADGTADAPTAEANVLKVSAGTLRVTNAAAADGAAISFAAGTSLLVGTNDTATTALRSVKTGSSLTAAGGAIPVSFDVDAVKPAPFTTVLCTSANPSLSFACAKPWKGWRVTVGSSTENDVTTYTATAHSVGFVLIFR